jgi:hypothetical protein
MNHGDTEDTKKKYETTSSTTKPSYAYILI